MKRQARKLEHIKYSLELSGEPVTSGFADVELVHNALPELTWSEIDTSLTFLGKRLAAPFLINAMTGGTETAEAINAALGRAAQQCHIALAVGSQTAALADPQLAETFRAARRENPGGVVLANLGAQASPEMAVKAVEMVEADGLQLHLNVPQELAMAEGDRDFRGVLNRIGQTVRLLPVPVIVKEVGFGLSRDVVRRLFDAGVRYLDVSGRGGTNFVAIENCRSGAGCGRHFPDWGIPTAVSLLEAASLALPVRLIASGGIRTAVEAAKALAIGAETVGIAGPFLQILMNESEEALCRHIRQLADGLKAIMLMTGSANLSDLRQQPVIVLGKTREWLEQRGIDTSSLARRGSS